MNQSCDWQINKEKMSERGQYLLETGQWSDCNFLVGEELQQQQIFKGHKLLLAMASPVFEAMFYSDLAEKNDPIPITDIQPEPFKILLKYIYTDTFELDSVELAFKLWYCAKKYMLPSLVKKCTNYLRYTILPKNVCRMYEHAKMFDESMLMDECLKVIRTQTDKVLKDPSWEDIELETLLKVFEQEDLHISSEVELFTALERWAKSQCSRKSLDPNNREFLRSVIENALLKIRFLSLTPVEFAKDPGTSLLLTNDEAFAILMNIVYIGTKIPMPKGFCTHSKSRAKPVEIQSTVPNTIHNPQSCFGRTVDRGFGQATQGFKFGM